MCRLLLRALQCGTGGHGHTRGMIRTDTPGGTAAGTKACAGGCLEHGGCEGHLAGLKLDIGDILDDRHDRAP